MARLELEPDTITVTLSRRNLLALLTKLDWPASSRTIITGNCHHRGTAIDGILLGLRAEDDPQHYRDRPEPAGLMHPRTESDIRRTAHAPDSTKGQR